MKGETDGKGGKSARRGVKLIVGGLIVVVVIAFAVLRGDELEELAKTLRGGSLAFAGLAFAAQMGKYLAQGRAYVFCFRAVGERLGFGEGLKLVFGTFFANTVAPSLNLAGVTLVADDSAQRGIPPGAAASAALLMQLTVDSAFVCVMAVGFAVLALTAGLRLAWLLLGLAATVLVACLALALFLAGSRPSLVKRLVRPLERLADRAARRFGKSPAGGFIDDLVDSFSDAARRVAGNPRSACAAFGCSLLASACELACFSLAGITFGISHPEALVCGYVVATLFAMISFVPQGVGVVEAAVLVAFSLFGVGQAGGMAAVMLYRAVVFWMPFLIGAVVVQRMGLLRRLGA